MNPSLFLGHLELGSTQEYPTSIVLARSPAPPLRVNPLLCTLLQETDRTRRPCHQRADGLLLLVALFTARRGTTETVSRTTGIQTPGEQGTRHLETRVLPFCPPDQQNYSSMIAWGRQGKCAKCEPKCHI